MAKRGTAKPTKANLDSACLALMAANFAHDLAQPLQKLVSTVEDFEEFALAGKLTDTLSTEFRVKLMGHLKDINGITGAARSLFRERSLLPAKAFDASEFLKTLVANCKSEAQKKGVKVRVLKAPAKSLTLYGNLQLFEKLVGEVLQYCLGQACLSPAPLIELEAVKRDARTQLRIKHSGPRLPKEEVYLLFRAYAGGLLIKNKIGLSMAKAAAQQASGSFAVDEGSDGTIFTLSLPNQASER